MSESLKIQTGQTLALTISKIVDVATGQCSQQYVLDNSFKKYVNANLSNKTSHTVAIHPIKV